MGFLLRTAIRDSRRNRGKLFLFMSSIILGIAALVAINSFNYSLEDDINRQAASLLGADLVTSGNRAITPELQYVLDSLDGEFAREQELLSMMRIMKTDESQFVRVKAVEGGFPFYGKLKTIPVEAAALYKQERIALVDDGLMLQKNLNIGDLIKLGDSEFKIGGRLQNAFGSAGIGSSFAPSVYVGLPYLDETNLVRQGSLINYNYYAKLNADFDIDAWKEAHKDNFREQNLRLETIQDRKQSLNRAFDSLNDFLNLVALVSLILGCIGVASSVFIYVKSKISSIAVFRCLGMKGMQAFLIYFIQISLLGIIGVLVGAALGSLVQVALPIVLKDLLPFEVNLGISWRAIFEGVGMGIIVTILFSLVPLLSVRKISPLRTLRAGFEEDTKNRDPLIYGVYALILISLLAFLWILVKDFVLALQYTVALVMAFGLLLLVANFVIWFVKRAVPRHWSFVLRQGLSNLYRPNNQTRTLLVSIGLGTAVLTTLFVIQGLLLGNVEQMDAGNQPNIILYGIESNQKEEIAKVTKQLDMPVLQQVPIVTMRLDEWKGKTKKEWLADSTLREGRWAMRREARVTYRDTLDSNEKLIEGKMTSASGGINDSVYISLQDDYAEALGVDLGDELVFNVQGARMKTYVGSIREIDFANMMARFFIVFPTGVIEKAPQFHVLVTKSPGVDATASYRSAIVKDFPNVSVVDLSTILDALSEILAKVSYVIKFMAVFCILTGLIVLLSSLMLSKFQRIRESVLLRTLGANAKQVLAVNATEYAILGALSAFTGIIISLMGSYLMAKYMIELPFIINWWPILIVFTLVVSLTVVIGLLNTREVVRTSPLAVLRKVG